MKIGILKTGRAPGKLRPRFGDYAAMFDTMLLGTEPLFSTTIYDVTRGRYPRTLDECGGYLITGSPSGAYDPLPWIPKLKRFIRAAAKRKKKMVGICFGHQMIAHTLGGKAQKSEKGWGVGLRRFRIMRVRPWMRPAVKECRLYFSHQDQAIKLPAGALLLAGDAFCPHQMYSVGGHIFCIQGHPEFSKTFARALYDVRHERLGREGHRRALESLAGRVDNARVRRWIVNFFKGK